MLMGQFSVSCQILNFIKNLAQVINIFLKIRQNKKIFWSSI